MHVVVLGDVGYSGGGVCCKVGSTRCARLVKSERRGLLVFSRLHLGFFPAQGRPVLW
jgi:hypothetical protein